MTRTLRTVLAASVLASCGAGAAGAFEREKSDAGVALHLAGDTVVVVVEGLTRDEQAAVERAARTWAAVSCAHLRFVFPAAGARSSAAVTVVVRRGAVANATFAAHTEPHVADKYQGVVDGAVITLAEGAPFSTAKDAKAVAPDALDLETVVLHELGHALGLAHPHGFGLDRRTVMLAGAKPGVVRRVLGSDDVAGLCAVFARQPSGGR